MKRSLSMGGSVGAVFLLVLASMSLCVCAQSTSINKIAKSKIVTMKNMYWKEVLSQNMWYPGAGLALLFSIFLYFIVWWGINHHTPP
ncbi:MAG: hypothetical protein NT038_04475 [Euryarchaeota archaeon]|nr:hypothetical protein [Euryarchaeota archaeon]